MQPNRPPQDQIELPSSDDTGDFSEMHPTATQRLELAYRVLSGGVLLLVLSVALLILGPESKKEEAAAIFEFSKIVVPPLITLVIGFYFSSDTRTPNNDGDS